MAVKITCPTCGYSTTSRTLPQAEYGQRRHSCQLHLDRAARRAATVRRHQQTAIERPCTHATHHPHGSNARATLDGCKCDPCRDAAYKATKRWRARVATQGHVNVDTAPAVAHIKKLQAAGLGYKRIAELAGLNPSHIYPLLWGRPDRRDGKPRTRARKTTVNAILAVPLPTISDLGATVIVDPTGTVRRLQALITLGWSVQRLADHAQTNRQALDGALAGRPVIARTAQTVRTLYDQLWNQAPPERDQREKIAASRARHRAQTAGWAPPLAWDDDTIDNPDAQPDLGDTTDDDEHVDELAVDTVVNDRRPLRLTGVDRVEAVRRLTRLGLSDRAMAELVQCAPETVLRTRKTHDIPTRYVPGEAPAA